MDFMNKIREIRKRLHLTQEKFGAGIDVEKSFIGQLESGIKKPGRKTIEKICAAYGIDPREFFETVQKPVIKTKDPLIAEIERLPADKKDLLLKQIISEKDMSIEGIRDILKHTEKEKLWEKVRKKERRTG